jgi:hypothetical protein
VEGGKGKRGEEGVRKYKNAKYAERIRRLWGRRASRSEIRGKKGMFLGLSGSDPEVAGL